MREVNLRSIDLNLLVVLQVLLDTQHISRAAEQLHMSQPAVSRALQRLRVTFSDPLLVRTSHGYDLTERARSIQSEIGSLLQQVRQLVTPPVFDPATSRRCLRITGMDFETSLYLPKLTRFLHQKAPEMSLEILRQRDNPFERIDKGECHFLLSGMLPRDEKDHPYELLLDSMHSVCVMHRDNPLAGKPITVDSYAAALHGIINITGSGPGHMDQILGRTGRQRKVVLRLASFISVGDFCDGTNLVFTLPRRLAERITNERRSLVMRELPEELRGDEIRFYLYWHGRDHHDPMCQWIRKVLPAVLAS
ncbi:LysR family transcriptional regulator [Endozoicomonadaceae bacterium StTr2]